MLFLTLIWLTTTVIFIVKPENQLKYYYTHVPPEIGRGKLVLHNIWWVFRLRSFAILVTLKLSDKGHTKDVEIKRIQ